MTKNELAKFLKKKEKEMRGCNHLFLKIEEGVTYYACHSSDCGSDPPVVVCLKCGLTNKYLEMNYLEKQIAMELRAMNSYYRGMAETNEKVFVDQFRHAWRKGGKDFNDSVFNVISPEVLRLEHPKALYDIAKALKPAADDTEIFETMKTLNEMETPRERFKIDSLDKAHDLIERYRREVKVLEHETK